MDHDMDHNTLCLVIMFACQSVLYTVYDTLSIPIKTFLIIYHEPWTGLFVWGVLCHNGRSSLNSLQFFLEFCLI